MTTPPTPTLSDAQSDLMALLRRMKGFTMLRDSQAFQEVLFSPEFLDHPAHVNSSLQKSIMTLFQCSLLSRTHEPSMWLLTDPRLPRMDWSDMHESVKEILPGNIPVPLMSAILDQWKSQNIPLPDRLPSKGSEFPMLLKHAQNYDVLALLADRAPQWFACISLDMYGLRTLEHVFACATPKAQAFLLDLLDPVQSLPPSIYPNLCAAQERRLLLNNVSCPPTSSPQRKM